MEDLDEEIPNVFEDLNINDDPFTMEEYRRVKSALKLKKAARPDDIPPSSIPATSMKYAWSSATRPSSRTRNRELWSFMNIIPVPKSGDLSKTENHGRWKYLKVGGASSVWGHGERVEREPITGVWGRSPQRGPGAEALVGVRGQSPLKLKAFWFLNVPRSSKTLRCLSRFDSV